VSHDRWFINQLATRIVDIEATGITDYAGTYDEYVASYGTDRLNAQEILKAESLRKQKIREKAKK
jgi:ATPase subunit of ABC transporter with duplicated ATPase domains